MSSVFAKAKGFTLLEVIITAAILSVLAAIAFPMYQNYVTRGHRAAATACLTEGAHFMERTHTLSMRYDETADGGRGELPKPGVRLQAAASIHFFLGGGGHQDLPGGGRAQGGSSQA